ncbi:DUF2785 domain-containing protein [Bacillus cytotoxicus]|uniref:DUF2785 domain-containing protein n=1 Tax=Bacillus cereus group sp. BfR-BA-01492 TaxID=2920361 RepID=UPI001F58BA56|nr:DUF2785 domain-containing protein [Bacillus cereus group sp. BfR-BA-01492]EMA6343465.1 DUF2785 domain-containing protein [Bacillus cytotoxicus]
MNIQTLQQQLELIQQNDYSQMQHFDIDELTLGMMQHIGTTDSYIRNQLIYESFSHFIQHHFLSHDQLELLLATCLSEEYLYFEISSPYTDGVFTRSYTALLIALIIQFDNVHTFLLPETIIEIKEKLITCMNLESDFRGHIEQKGWAHSIAHISDAFHQLVQNPHISGPCYEEIIHCLLNKIFIHSTIYYNNEDERIATPLLAMLYCDFPKEAFFTILYKKMKRLPQIRKRLSLNEYCMLCANIKTFLRTLFFRTREDPHLTSLANRVDKILRELPQYY